MSASRRLFLFSVWSLSLVGVSLSPRACRAQRGRRQSLSGLDAMIEEVVEETMTMLLLGILIAIPLLLIGAALQWIREELSLTIDQIERLKALGGQLRKQITEAIAKLDPSQGIDLAGLLRQLEPEYQARLNEILTPKQRERYAEIALQLRGARAIVEEPVLSDLNLSKEQQTSIAELIAEFDEERTDGSRPTPALLQLARLYRNRQQLDQEAVELLSETQRSEWEQMQGKPLKLKWADLIAAAVRQTFEDAEDSTAPAPSP